MKELYSFEESKKSEYGLSKYNVLFTIDENNFINGYRYNLKTEEKTPIYGRNFNDKLLELIYFKRPTLELFVLYGHKTKDGIYGSWTKATRQDMENVTSNKMQFFPEYIFAEKAFSASSFLTSSIVNEQEATKSIQKLEESINYDEIRILQKIKSQK